MGTSINDSLVLDPVVRRSILEAVELGAFQNHAARVAGIKPGVLAEWIAKGSGSLPDPSGVYTEFFEELEVARANAVMKLLKYLNAAAQAEKGKGVGAITWHLSKLDPKHYGDKIEVSGAIEHRKTYSFLEPPIPVEGQVVEPEKPAELEGGSDGGQAEEGDQG